MVLKEQVDSEQYGTARLNPIPRQFSKRDGQKPRTLETSQRLTGEKSKAQTSSAGGSLVKTSALRVKEEESLKVKRGQVFGGSFTRRLGYFDQDSCSLRTFQLSLLSGSTLSLQTLPKRGMMQNGLILGHPTSEHPTKGKESLSSPIPTPQASDSTAGSIIGENDRFVQLKSGAMRKINQNGVDGSVGLARHAMMFPTPTARMWKDCGAPSEMKRDSPSLQAMAASENRGKLNPTWVEWLMGLPEGWTALFGKNALKLWETVSSHKSRNGLEKE